MSARVLLSQADIGTMIGRSALWVRGNLRRLGKLPTPDVLVGGTVPGWEPETIRAWLLEHPELIAPTTTTTERQAP